MSRITYCTTLDDAYFFLNQAKGLPDIPSVKPLRQRYLRSCIFFAWIALEEILDCAVTDLEETGKLHKASPHRLRDKVKLVLALRGRHTFRSEDFEKARRIRNSLVHPTPDLSEDVLLTLQKANHVFQDCLKTIHTLYSHNVTLRL